MLSFVLNIGFASGVYRFVLETRSNSKLAYWQSCVTRKWLLQRHPSKQINLKFHPIKLKSGGRSQDGRADYEVRGTISRD